MYIFALILMNSNCCANIPTISYLAVFTFSSVQLRFSNRQKSSNGSKVSSNFWYLFVFRLSISGNFTVSSRREIFSEKYLYKLKSFEISGVGGEQLQKKEISLHFRLLHATKYISVLLVCFVTHRFNNAKEKKKSGMDIAPQNCK